MWPITAKGWNHSAVVIHVGPDLSMENSVNQLSISRTFLCSKSQPAKPKKHIRQVSEIQHEIYLKSDWLRTLSKNIWQIQTVSMEVQQGVLWGSQGSVPLHPLTYVSCDLMSRGDQQTLKFASVPSAQYVFSCKFPVPHSQAPQLHAGCFLCWGISVWSPLSQKPSLRTPTQLAKPEDIVRHFSLSPRWFVSQSRSPRTVSDITWNLVPMQQACSWARGYYGVQVVERW